MIIEDTQTQVRSITLTLTDAEARSLLFFAGLGVVHINNLGLESLLAITKFDSIGRAMAPFQPNYFALKDALT